MATNIHPFIKFIYETPRSMAISDIADKAGIARTSIIRWKNGTSPKLIDLEAVLEVLGFELVIAKKHRPCFQPERETLLIHEVKQILNSINPVTDNQKISREIVVKICSAFEGQVCLDLTQECINQSRIISEHVNEINTLVGKILKLEVEQNRFNGMTKTLREMSIGDECEFVAGNISSKIVRKIFTTARKLKIKVSTRKITKNATVYIKTTRIE